VKVEKGYDYIPVLISKILKTRVDDDDVEGVTRAIDLNTSYPALISPTIAHIPAPPTKEEEEQIHNRIARYLSIPFLHCTYINSYCAYKYI
jgi:hypothetical protein